MPPPGAPPAPSWSRRTRALAGAGIVLAAAVAYLGCFRVPFVFDDEAAVTQNATIRDLRQIGTVLTAQTGNGSGVRGRPLVNLSLAVNYAVGGTDPFGYHAFNLAVHALCALLLFALLRRIFAAVGARSPDALAGVVALLWAVHPLQTETVISPIQRTESLMALCYLLILYVFVRSTESARPRFWQAAAVAACLAGMACKEVMVSAPLLVLLYDRTFVAGSFAGAWRRRRGLYAALAGTWLLLGWLVAGSGGRGGTVGFGLGVSSWDYALTQCRAVVLYLKLAFWPHPLVVDYGMGLDARLAAVLPQALLLVGLLGATAWALVRRPAAGFAGAWFFAILAPSSSVLPLASQTIAEHRLYLPLAAVLALAVAGGHRLAGRAVLPAALALAVALGVLTVRRTADYESALGLWRDTVAKAPDNPRAHYNLGVLLERAGATAGALEQFEAALRLKPDYAVALNNRGHIRFLEGRLDGAAEDFAAALRSDPDLAAAHYNLGRVRFEQQRAPEAVAEYEAALRLKPDYPDALVNLGIALAREGRTAEALPRLRAAVQLVPADADAQYNLGRALDQAGDLPAAVSAYRAALRLQPGLAAAHNNLAYALARQGQTGEAIREVEEAVRLQPDDVNARVNLVNLLLAVGRDADAVRELREVLRLQPDLAPARELLRRLAPPRGDGP